MKKLFSAAILLAFASQVQAYDIRSGILSYYSFNTTTTNDSAFTNNFTAVSSAVASPSLVPGQMGTALSLGTNQYLRIDHDPSNAQNGLPIYRAGSYSILMWVKGPPVAGRYLFAEGSTLSNNPLLILQTGSVAGTANKFDVIIRNDANVALINHVVSTNVVFDNTFHHVAWVDDNGAVKVYIDGNLDPANFSYVPSGAFTFNTTAIGTLIRGAVATANIYTNGPIDEVSLWERVLTQSEVQQIMTNGIATPVPTLPAAIITQPVSQTKNFKDNVTFAVTAAGTRPNNVVAYQWFSNNVAVADATNRTFRILGVTTANSGQTFRVTVSNGILSPETSSNVTLTVLADGPVNLRTNIVNYWPLDAITNIAGVTNSIDLYSRNDLRLTNITEGVNLQPGQFGNSILFDNLANTHAVRSGGAPIFNTNAYTVSLWVKADGTFQSDARVYSEASTAGANPIFTIGTAIPVSAAGVARIVIRGDNNVVLLDRNSTRTVFDAGGATWHNIVWVDSNGKARLYVDGVVDETDFTYTPGTLTLNVSSVGSVVRATSANGIFGNIDDVATWNRALSYSDVQQLTNSVPTPLAATPPSVTTQPNSTNVFTGATVTFSVVVAGTGPFTYQWQKSSVNVPVETNSSLVFTNVQLTNAGSYSVAITGPGGSTNSQPATLTVTARPAPPTALAIDFNERGTLPSDSEPGFDSFTLDGSGATTLPTTRLFGGVEVTVGGSNGTTADSRLRGAPVNAGAFTQQKLLQDFVFSPPTTGTEGLDVTIKFLAPNQLYAGTVWSYDQVNAGARVSDWFANGVQVQDNYTFDGSIAPTNNTQYTFTFSVTSDAQGTVVIQGRREATGTGVSVFLNALRLEIPQTIITKIEIVGGNVRLTLQTPDSSKAHTVEKTDNLTTISWSAVTGVTTTILSPTSLQLEFPQPANGMQFYRINRAP